MIKMEGSSQRLIVVLQVFVLLATVTCIEPPKCKGKEIKVNTDDSDKMTECFKENGGETFKEVPKEKFACVGKCILMKKGLLDESGIPKKDNVFQMINATMPEEVLEELDMRMGKCIDDSANVDHAEPTCESYKPLTECTIKAFMEVCKIDEKEIQGDDKGSA